MTIEKAIDTVLWNYGRALLMNRKEEVIRNPVAWALYQTWKKADKEEKCTHTKK